MKKAWLWWSSGKDSAWALQTLRESGEVEVTRLLTTLRPVAEANVAARVAMHDVRSELLDAQAEALGMPIDCIELPFPASNVAYEAAIAPAFAAAEACGVRTMAYGDLFLEDIRAYRETLLAARGFDALFPIWQTDTETLGRDIVASGLRAEVVCVDLRVLDASFAGVAYDEAFLERLPSGVDSCGENGEFHTFVWDGPIFRRPIAVQRGAVVERDGFAFADLALAPA